MQRLSIMKRLFAPLAFSVVTAIICACSPSANAQYRLSPGDTVEMTIVGLPDLRQRAQVDLDGNVSLPLIGAIKAIGMPIAELRTRAQEMIARKVVRRQTNEGREYPVVIEPDEVTLSIVEYRPVYVNGDVSRPGAVAFMSDMTARQAVALSGGYDVMRFRISNPFIQAAELEGDLTTFSAQILRQQVRIASLEAELTNSPQFPTRTFETQPAVPAQFVSTVTKLEADQYTLQKNALAAEKSSLERLIKVGESELSSLSAQREREQEGAKLDAGDLQRLNTIYDRGNLNMNRVTETRRNLLLSETRLLQTNVQIQRVQREREIDQRKLHKLGDERRLEITRELSDARVQLVATQAKIQAARDKLLYTASVRSQLVRGTGGRPDITIVRRLENGTRNAIKADEETVLAPGDVLEVALIAEIVSDSAANGASSDKKN